MRYSFFTPHNVAFLLPKRNIFESFDYPVDDIFNRYFQSDIFSKIEESLKSKLYRAYDQYYEENKEFFKRLERKINFQNQNQNLPSVTAEQFFSELATSNSQLYQELIKEIANFLYRDFLHEYRNDKEFIEDLRKKLGEQLQSGKLEISDITNRIEKKSQEEDDIVDSDDDFIGKSGYGNFFESNYGFLDNQFLAIPQYLINEVTKKNQKKDKKTVKKSVDYLTVPIFKIRQTQPSFSKSKNTNSIDQSYLSLINAYNKLISDLNRLYSELDLSNKLQFSNEKLQKIFYSKIQKLNVDYNEIRNRVVTLTKKIEQLEKIKTSLVQFQNIDQSKYQSLLLSFSEIHEECVEEIKELNSLLENIFNKLNTLIYGSKKLASDKITSLYHSAVELDKIKKTIKKTIEKSELKKTIPIEPYKGHINFNILKINDSIRDFINRSEKFQRYADFFIRSEEKDKQILLFLKDKLRILFGLPEIEKLYIELLRKNQVPLSKYIDYKSEIDTYSAYFNFLNLISSSDSDKFKELKTISEKYIEILKQKPLPVDYIQPNELYQEFAKYLFHRSADAYSVFIADFLFKVVEESKSLFGLIADTRASNDEIEEAYKEYRERFKNSNLVQAVLRKNKNFPLEEILEGMDKEIYALLNRRATLKVYLANNLNYNTRLLKVEKLTKRVDTDRKIEKLSIPTLKNLKKNLYLDVKEFIRRNSSYDFDLEKILGHKGQYKDIFPLIKQLNAFISDPLISQTELYSLYYDVYRDHIIRYFEEYSLTDSENELSLTQFLEPLDKAFNTILSRRINVLTKIYNALRNYVFAKSQNVDFHVTNLSTDFIKNLVKDISEVKHSNKYTLKEVDAFLSLYFNETLISGHYDARVTGIARNVISKLIKKLNLFEKEKKVKASVKDQIKKIIANPYDTHHSSILTQMILNNIKNKNQTGKELDKETPNQEEEEEKMFGYTDLFGELEKENEKKQFTHSFIFSVDFWKKVSDKVGLNIVNIVIDKSGVTFEMAAPQGYPAEPKFKIRIEKDSSFFAKPNTLIISFGITIGPKSFSYENISVNMSKPLDALNKIVSRVSFLKKFAKKETQNPTAKNIPPSINAIYNDEIQFTGGPNINVKNTRQKEVDIDTLSQKFDAELKNIEMEIKSKQKNV